VVSPNNDTIYGAGFADLTSEAVVIQTPADSPQGHYWTIQIVDVLTNVRHQLGSASRTPGGKFLLAGPNWTGGKPDGFIDVLRMPANVAGVFPRSFAARSEQSKAQARAVLNQIGMYPLSEDQPGQLDFAYDTYATHAVFPPGVTAEMIAANPDAARPDWVKPRTFWDDLGAMLDFNPQLGPEDTAIGERPARWSRCTAATSTTGRSWTGPRCRPMPRCVTRRPMPRPAWTPGTGGGGSPARGYGAATGTAAPSPR
jgi:hypothetical protein